MERSTRASIIAVASLVFWVEAAVCRAQQTAPPSSRAVPPPQQWGGVGTTAPAVAQPTPSPGAPAPPAVSPGAGQRGGGATLPPALSQPQPAGTSVRPISEHQSVDLKPAPLEPSDLRFPINLATALRLSDARPLMVAAAQASVWVAEAQLTRAKILWVPQLNIGADYTRHDGGGPDFNKGIMTAPSVNFFYGGTGMTQNVALTDVFFQPLAARQMLNSRQMDIQTAKNDALMMTADAYFRVHQARGMFAGGLYCVERGHDLIQRIASLAGDLVPKVEVDRARNLVAELSQQVTSSREYWRVNSANLTQLLRLDPRAVVVPLENDHLQITLIDPARTLDDLIPVALTNRPELGSQQALVQAVAARIRRERGRMLLPSILINGFQTPYEMIQAGIFGLGPNSSLNQWAGRADLSYQALWELDAFGLGNMARIKEQRGEQSKAIIELFRRRTRWPAMSPALWRTCNRRPRASVRPIAPCGRRSSLSTATTRDCARPTDLAMSWCSSTGRKKRCLLSSS